MSSFPIHSAMAYLYDRMRASGMGTAQPSTGAVPSAGPAPAAEKGYKRSQQRIQQQLQELQPAPPAPGQPPQSPLQRVEQRLDQMGQLTPAMRALLGEVARSAPRGPGLSMDMGDLEKDLT